MKGRRISSSVWRRVAGGGLLASSAVFAGGAALSGCSGPTAAPPDSVTARDHLAERVVAVMNGSGLPVLAGNIECKYLPKDGHADTCFGLTADTPTQKVEGDFDRPDGRSAAGGGCPGTLTVRVGAAVVTATKVDPCR